MCADDGNSWQRYISDSPVEPQKIKNKKALGGTPNAESEFWETGFGQECFLHPAANY